jgi:hypothetical protein
MKLATSRAMFSLKSKSQIIAQDMHSYSLVCRKEWERIGKQHVEREGEKTRCT